MPRKLFAAGLLLSFLVAAPACKKDDLVNETTSEIDSLADEMVKAITSADDKKQGVADAQKLLDAKKGDLGPKMAEMGELRGFQVSEDVAAAMTSSLAGSVLEVESLKINLMSETMKDPELAAALDKLTGDFTGMLTP
ncbi:MAG: hypothetical protein KUG77_24035 [Nannocystaceae bacterium]|nr:hypothetical protein [Nannocystaceae bacterium]